MRGTFGIRALRPVGLRGRHLAPGAVADASAADAAFLVALGQAELLDPRDDAALQAAMQRRAPARRGSNWRPVYGSMVSPL